MVWLKEKKKLCAYIDRFTKVAVVVGGMNEILKCWIMEKRLRLDNSLWESPGLKQAHKRKDLLNKAHPYISYEEIVLSNGGNRGLENPELSWTSKKLWENHRRTQLKPHSKFES